MRASTSSSDTVVTTAGPAAERGRAAGPTINPGETS
jgi:hypothetical protein